MCLIKVVLAGKMMLGFETWTVDNGGNGKNDGKWTTGLTGEEGIELTEETMFAIVSGCWVLYLVCPFFLPLGRPAGV